MASMAAAGSQGSWVERHFKFPEHGTTLARDTMAGVTTFIVMSYIIFLNPQILSFRGIPGLESKGLPFDGVLTATCVVAAVMTDKATVEIPTPVAGSVLALGGAVGDVLAVGAELVRIDAPGLPDSVAPAAPKPLPETVTVASRSGVMRRMPRWPCRLAAT